VTNPSTGSGQALGSSTTIFVGSHYEITDGVVTKYYFAGAQRIAMRKDGALYYLIGDHLGSTSITTDASGNAVSEIRYKAWGEVRYTSGSEMTKYQFTGQYSHQFEFGLLFYQSRMYDPYLKRFTQADTIVPPGAQGLDRYAYVNNSPMNYVDPSGHICVNNPGSDDEVAMPGGCGGAPNPNWNGQVTPSPSGWTGHEGGSGDDEAISQPWQTTLNADIGIHAGPLGDIFVPEYNSDDYNGAPFIYNYSTDDNFYLHFDVYYNEASGVTVSDILVVNYSDYPMFLNTMWFESNGESTYIQWEGYGKTLPHGFGSDFEIPGPETSILGNQEVILGFELGYYVDLGQGPFKIYPDFYSHIPALQDVKIFFDTGEFPASNPLMP
jgi:RHS repeat-associated protein